MKNTQFRRAAAALAVLALLMAGICPAFSLAETVESGLLRTAVLYDISTLDVARTSDDYLVPMNVFDRLFETRVTDGTAQVVKSLCEDWSLSPDGLTYAFTLRDGILFSNGERLTAEDVRFTFERLLRIGDQNTDIPLEVLGGRALLNHEADRLEGFRVQDDLHFTITLENPNAGFLAELSSPAMSIVDMESMTEDFGREVSAAIGTGPYRITEWVPNDHFTLEYRADFWGETPSVKKLVVRVIPEAGTQNLMFQNGELDLLDLKSMDSAIVSGLYKTRYASRIVSAPHVGMTFMALNENQAYLKDVRVRKAIGMALDVDTLIRSLYDGDAVPEKGIIPTGVWGYNPDLEGFSYDPQGAAKLLEEAGYAPGEVRFELCVDNASTGTTQLLAQAIRQMLGQAGIEAELTYHDHAAWLDRRISGKMDAFLGTWGMDYNDPANIMYTFFGNEQNTAQRSLNYPDTEVMERVAAARAIADDTAREAEYRALEKKIIQEDAAWIPLLEEMHLYCMGERVVRFTPQWAGYSDFYVTDVVLK